MTHQKLDYRLQPATEELANRLVATMRAEDRAECEAFGLSPLEGLRQSIAGSRDPLIATVDGKPAAAFGCIRRGALSITGIPWMLTTDLVLQHKKLFLSENRRILAEWLLDYERLFNVVDARYVKALRWMRWLGFTEYPPQPHGPRRMLFVPFEMVKL